MKLFCLFVLATVPIGGCSTSARTDTPTLETWLLGGFIMFIVLPILAVVLSAVERVWPRWWIAIKDWFA